MFRLREVSPPEILIIILGGVVDGFEFGLRLVLPAGHSRLVLPTHHHLHPLDALLLELHAFVEEILVAEEAVEYCLEVAHPLQSHLHLQVLVLQGFLLALEDGEGLLVLGEFLLHLGVVSLQLGDVGVEGVFLILLLCEPVVDVLLLPLEFVVPALRMLYICLN